MGEGSVMALQSSDSRFSITARTATRISSGVREPDLSGARILRFLATPIEK